MKFALSGQRSIGWYRRRLGCWNGSEIGKLFVNGRGGEMFGETAKGYIAKVAGERRLNKTIINDTDLFAYYLESTEVTTKAMRWGIDNEDAARQLYQTVTGTKVITVDRCCHKTIRHFAASPDGIIEGTRKGIEIKCMNIENFMKMGAALSTKAVRLARKDTRLRYDALRRIVKATAETIEALTNEIARQTEEIAEYTDDVQITTAKALIRDDSKRIKTLDKEIALAKKELEETTPRVRLTKDAADTKYKNDTLRNINAMYFYQIQAEIACAELDSVDLVIYNPFLKKSILIITLYPDAETQQAFSGRICEAEQIIKNHLTF